jgi:sec-independent protein translocase protein TatA
MNLGMQELIVILIIVFFLFGAKRLPEMGKGIGEGIKNFKKSMKGEEPPTNSTGNTGTTTGTHA